MFCFKKRTENTKVYKSLKHMIQDFFFFFSGFLEGFCFDLFLPVLMFLILCGLAILPLLALTKVFFVKF